MFNTLLESKAKRERNTGGTVASAVIHTGAILLLLFGTGKAAQEVQEAREEKIEFVEIKKEEAPPPKEEPPPPPPDVVAAPPPPKGFQVLTAPVEIPDVIPEIDLTKQVTNEEDFSGVGVEGGVARGVVGGTGPVDVDQPYFEFQVEKPAMAIPGGQPAPNYPEILRNAGVEGQVLVQFVVNTDGKADMSTFKVLKSDHDLFTSAVRNVLPRYKFYPAETGGRKVKMWVQMPFVFSLKK